MRVEDQVLRSPSAPDGGCVLLPHRSAAVPVARRALVDELQRERVAADVVADVAVVASELLGNAVRHAAPLGDGDLLLRWRVEARGVSVEVVDGGGGPLVEAVAPEGATGGRGLGIVSALARGWGSRVDGAGRRTVWARVAADPGAPLLADAC